MDLMKNDALKMAVRLLEGNSDSSGLNIQKTPFNYSGTIIGIYSPAVLHAYDDQDNHTGLKNDGTIEVNIPGSSYEELGESKFIYLPNGGHYHLTTKATGEGSFDLKIKNYSDSTLTSEQLYLDVPQTTQTTTSLSLDTPSPVLSVDTNNDGTVDQQIQVTSTLTGEDVADTTPPVTQVQKTGTQGTNDWYTSNVSLTLTSQDDNAGILKTLYYFDGESTIYTYTEPINLTSEGTIKIWYFSVDKAGNAEQPKSITIKIDKTDPTITITIPQNNAAYILKSTINTEWNTNDTPSGISSKNGTVVSGSAIDTNAIGTHNFTITATDNAGNTKSTTVTYKVIYRFDGFLQPINDTGHTQTCGSDCTVSVFKGGSTVSVKLQLKDANGNVIQSTTPPQWTTPQQGSAIADSVNETDFTDPTDSGTTYSWDGAQYHYNWKTKDIPSGYHWLIGVRLDDGQAYTVNIGLR